MKDKGVFCFDCKHYARGHHPSALVCYPEECWAEGNTRSCPDYRRNWKQAIRKPKKINKYNDCRWFEEKAK